MMNEKSKHRVTWGVFLIFALVYLGLWSSYGHLFTPAPVEAEWTPDVVVIHEAQRVEFEATGYAIGPPYASITKNGSSVFNKGSIKVGGVDVFTIAVDPKVIPLGSIVFIDSLGIAMATDTGKKIKGTLIDICFSDMDEAMEWGRRKVQLTVLRRGKGN